MSLQTDDQVYKSKTVIVSARSSTGSGGVQLGEVLQEVPRTTTEDVLGSGSLDETLILPSELQSLQDMGIVAVGTTLEEISKLDIKHKDAVLMATKITRAEKTLPKYEIESLHFYVMPDKVIEKLAVVDIDNPDDKTPGLQRSINDPGLGVSLGVEFCATCKRKSFQCPGHLGKIRLAAKVYNPIYIRDVIYLMTSVCPCCSKLVISPEVLALTYGITMDTPAEIRLKRIAEESAKVTEKGYKHLTGNNKSLEEEAKALGITVGAVSGCVPNNIYIIDRKKSNFKKTGRIEYVRDAKDTEKVDRFELTPDEAYQILKGFEDDNPDQVEILGLGKTKPTDLIMNYIMVLSPLKRGAALGETGINSDRLGAKYVTILKKNYQVARIKSGQDVHKKASKRSITLSEARGELYEAILSLFKSDSEAGAGGSYATSQTSIIEELTGKQGIYRGELMSVRVNFSARTVIGPNPMLEYGQVGVPQSWAKFLTVRDRIANVNIKALTDLLRKGRVTHIMKSGTDTDNYFTEINDHNRATIEVQIGDIVERWLQDGDYLTLNRQPTLHRSSTLAMRVKLMDALTVSLHLSYTTGYNADFDGDEMNLHVAQTIEATAELSTIMTAASCIANEQNSAPIVGLVMDNILSAYILTNEDEIMSESTWSACVIKITARDDLGTLEKRRITQGIPKYSGRALFSALLPAGFYYNRMDVVIKDGILISGVIKKEHIGPSPNSIIQELYMDKRFGISRTVSFLTDAPWVLNEWLLRHGFTVGIKDCIPPPGIKELVKKEVAEARMVIQQMDSVIDDPFEDQKRENAIMLKLGKIRDKIGSELSKMSSMKDNAFYVMITSKSKGSLFNLAQVLGIVGQQTAWGSRLPKTLSGGTRTLPHFKENEDSIESLGLIEHSYSEGLTNVEYFEHAMAAREGVLNTAMDTPSIGELRRDMMKLLEDLTIAYDGSARDAKDNVIQRIYGDDGLNAAALRRVIYKGNELFLPFDPTALAERLYLKYEGK